VEVFPVLKRIREKITGGKTFYQSPTDMGVNRAGFAITDEKAAFRGCHSGDHPALFPLPCEYAMGFTDRETVERVELFIEDFRLKPEHRAVVEPARCAAWRPRTGKRK